DDNCASTDWRRDDRADIGRSRRKEDSAPSPRHMEKPGHLRRAQETGAPRNSLKRRERPQRQHSITHPAASSRFRAAQRYRPQPNKSTAEQADSADAFETARAA